MSATLCCVVPIDFGKIWPLLTSCDLNFDQIIGEGSFSELKHWWRICHRSETLKGILHQRDTLLHPWGSESLSDSPLSKCFAGTSHAYFLHKYVFHFFLRDVPVNIFSSKYTATHEQVTRSAPLPRTVNTRENTNSMSRHSQLRKGSNLNIVCHMEA